MNPQPGAWVDLGEKFLRNPVSREDALRFAAIVRIPNEHADAFGLFLTITFNFTRDEHERSKRAARQKPKTEAKLKKIKAASEALLKELDGLDTIAGKYLGLYAAWHERFRPESPLADDSGRFQIMDLVEAGAMDEGLLLIASYRRAVKALCLAASTKEWPADAKGGRPPTRAMSGKPSDSAFNLFIMQLVPGIEMFGGKAIISRSETTGYGTLVCLLKAMRGHVPEGVIPDFAVNENGTVQNLDLLEDLRQRAAGSTERPGKSRKNPPQKS